MKVQIIIGLAWLSIIAFSCAQQSPRSDTEVLNLSATEFNKLYQNEGGQLIDIRTPSEFKQGHIAGSTLIDFYAPDFKNMLASLDTTKTIFLYCRSGNRSSKTITVLDELGFKKIVNLRNGIIDWQRSGLEQVKN